MNNSVIKPAIICITPVKNEAWILDLFLKTTSLWADYIIIADQHSDDGSRDIARQYEKVTLIDNDSEDFNEPERQELLLSAARKIPGEKLIIALDADEILSAEALDLSSWHKMLAAEPGTAFGFRWPLINQEFNEFWYSDTNLRYFAYRDDGATHIGNKIHSPRIPILSDTKLEVVDSFVVMHYQFVDWERMKSKHRWYQCYERVNFPNKNQISLYRMYHHMYNKKQLLPIPKSWFGRYLDRQINICSVHINKVYRWDILTDEYIQKFGVDYFKYVDVIGNNNLLLRYLSKTQKYSQTVLIRMIDKILKLLWK